MVFLRGLNSPELAKAALPFSFLDLPEAGLPDFTLFSVFAALSPFKNEA
jgi:hypothetical protein